MSLHQTPPGEGRQAAERTRYFNRKVKRGEKLSGWIAGHPHWYTCHTHKRPTKPCLHAITKGELLCAACGNKTETMGYVPFYDSVVAKPYFVLVYEDDRARLDKLRLHQFVTIMRDEGEHARIAVLPQLGATGPKYVSTFAERMDWCDLVPSLLHCWQIPELVAWYNCVKPKSDAPVSLPEKTQDEYTKELTDSIKAGEHSTAETFAGALVGPAAAEVIRARNEEFARKAPKPSKNGTHPPPCDG